MSFPGTYQITVAANGVTCLGTVTKTAETSIENMDKTLIVGDAGTYTRSDADTCIFTRTSGTNIENGDVVDVYWTGGIRYGLTCTDNGTSGESFLLDVGAGDSFSATPATACVVCKQVAVDITFDGDNLQLIGASASQRSLIIFYNAATVILAQEIVASSGWGWAYGLGVTNPLAGDAVTSITVSNGSATSTSNIKMCGLQA